MTTTTTITTTVTTQTQRENTQCMPKHNHTLIAKAPSPPCTVSQIFTQNSDIHRSAETHTHTIFLHSHTHTYSCTHAYAHQPSQSPRCLNIERPEMKRLEILCGTSSTGLLRSDKLAMRPTQGSMLPNPSKGIQPHLPPPHPRRTGGSRSTHHNYLPPVIALVWPLVRASVPWNLPRGRGDLAKALRLTRRPVR